MTTQFPLEGVEPPESYRLGGLHPIHIGDELGNRYVIVDKLGHGDVSTVWLASPTTDPGRCVALGVHMAEASKAAEDRVETRWSKLNHGDPDHPGKTNVLLPQDWFTIQGPNGSHFCLVTPVVGQSVSTATRRDLLEGSRPLPLGTTKRVVTSIIHGLGYAHSMGLAHGDLHPANLLLGLPNIVAESTTAMTALRGPPVIVPMPPKNSDNDNSLPSYLVEGIFAREMDPGAFTGPAKIGDWGDSFLSHDPPARTAWCGPYMTPEFNSSAYITLAEDIWMLGCGIFQMLTGRDLFGKKNDPASRVLGAMAKALGPPPDIFLQDWISYTKEMEGAAIVVQPGTQSITLKQRFVEAIGNHHKGLISDNDLDNIGSLLEAILVWEPSKRPTIKTVLSHPAMSFFSL